MKEKKIKDRYLLIRPLGKGGSGQVWLALDLWEGKEKAVKFLAPLDERGEREAAILKRLNPVSYTHLDVYKRQARGGMLRKKL